MAFFEGSKGVSTSIGGSSQVVNFNPVLNARGASSGTVNGGGATAQQSPSVSIQQGSGQDTGAGADSTGLVPRLNIGSNPIDETMNGAGYSGNVKGFTPGFFTDTQASAGAGSSNLLPMIGLAALAVIVLVSMR